MTFNDMLFLKIILPNISPTLNIIITIKIKEHNLSILKCGEKKEIL